MPPLLAIAFPPVDPVIVSIGSFEIRWYALAYIFGILFGWWYARRLVSNPRLWGPGGSPFTASDIGDYVIYATLGIVVGGRLGYVFVYNPAEYFGHPIDILRLWDGGMSFHGGFLGVVLATILFAWRKSRPLWSLIDIAATAAPVGLFLGRITNFVNGELYGRVTDVAWGVIFPTAIEANRKLGLPDDTPRHPSQIYEALLEGVLLFLILWLLVYRGRALRWPGLVGMFAACYGISRIIVEFFRQPDQQIGFLGGGLTMGMLLSIPMVLAGLALMFWTWRRGPRTGALENTATAKEPVAPK